MEDQRYSILHWSYPAWTWKYQKWSEFEISEINSVGQQILLTLALVKWNSCFMIVKLYWTHSRQNHPLCCTLLCHLVPTLLSKARIKNVLFSNITKPAAVGFGAKSEKKSSNPIPRSYFNGFWCQITDCLRKYKRKLHCPPHILKYEDTHNQ